ncbi:MAG: hypothetical protein AAF434_15410 [Pseudomonadota bacterium]
MNETSLRKSDFKTGIFLVLFCIWFLLITFVFMPFRETYGGVNNVWYVSPWIFPAVVLSLLLILAIFLTINAVKCGGAQDIFIGGLEKGRFPQISNLGIWLLGLICALSCSGCVYLVVKINEKILQLAEEAKWLADPSTAEQLSWSDPLAFIPVTLVGAMAMVTGSLTTVTAINKPSRAHLQSREFEKPNRELKTRFTIIVILFCGLVYILMPNIDFFVATLSFLTAFTLSFHVGSQRIARVALGCYICMCLIAFVIAIAIEYAAEQKAMRYALDSAILLGVLSCSIWVHVTCFSDPVARMKSRECLLVSWLTPLILVPVFRFGLLVPLPNEGAVIELMHVIRLAITLG